MRRPTFAYLKELEESQFLSREELEKLQYRKLKNLLSAAQQHSPWHAQHLVSAGIDLASDQPLNLADLQRLPTMDKADAQENRQQIAWMNVPGGAYKYNTGGSSGQPLVFYYGRWRQASDAAGRIRARNWFAVKPGDPEVYLWGAPVELNKTDNIKALRDRLLNQLVLNAFEMSQDNMARYAQAIQSFKPKCIYGYASSIALLAAYIKNTGKPFKIPTLRVVCTTGEPLYPEQRSLIQEVFQAPVANEFGSRDIGFTAHESPQGQMLLMSESIIMEVLDANGQAVAPGQAGEAVLTGLCSDAQPFIRYRTGDVVTLSDKQASDGKGLHVIDDVSGRTTDFVVKADGTIMHALAIIYILRAIEGIAEFKFIQHTLESVEVLFVANHLWNDQAGLDIQNELKKRLDPSVDVVMSQVEKIQAEASGKYRYVVSHVTLPNGLG